MKIIDRIFRGGSTVTATATPAEQAPTEQELAARFAAVAAQIDRGEGDIALALEEKEKLERQIRAASIRRERAAERASREARAAATAELNREGDEIMLKFGELLPQLLFATQDFQKFVDKIMAGHPGSDGRTFEQMLGVDHEFGRRIRSAIHAENLELDFDACLPGGKGSRPIPRTIGVRVPRFYTTDVLGNPVGTRYQ